MPDHRAIYNQIPNSLTLGDFFRSISQVTHIEAEIVKSKSRRTGRIKQHMRFCNHSPNPPGRIAPLQITHKETFITDRAMLYHYVRILDLTTEQIIEFISLCEPFSQRAKHILD